MTSLFTRATMSASARGFACARTLAGSSAASKASTTRVKHWHAGAGGPLPFISNSLAGRSLGRVVEEELIAVGIIYHQKAVAPRTILDRNALGLEFRAQHVQSGRSGLGRLLLGVHGNEHQSLANFPRPGVGQDQRAALPVHLRNMRSAILVVAPGAGEAEPVNVKAQRGLHVGYV